MSQEEHQDDLPAGGEAAEDLIDALRGLIERHSREWNVHHAAVVGALELVKAEVMQDWLCGDDDEDEEVVEPDDPAGS